jgi:hypothetical protein
MAGLLDFTKYDKDDPGAPVSPELATELRRLANLFLVSSITLVLLLVQVLALTLSVTFIPGPVKVTSGVVFLTGLAATYVYGIFVTSRARRWGWFALCVIPATSTPCSLAYSWIRRQEIEREVLEDARAPAGRQKRGGRKTRR